MVATLHSVTFDGLHARMIEVQAQISSGLPAFTIVGLPDKAVSEARERVRAALHSMGLSLPPKRLTVNLAPADVLKEGSHFDLPIALAVLTAMEIIPKDAIANYMAMGELSLGGEIRSVQGVLPATMFAHDNGFGMICPHSCGSEAAWIESADILAPKHLLSLLNHVKGHQVLTPPSPPDNTQSIAKNSFDFADVKGQSTAKRALEIAATGGHNVLMIGPPGSGKSMLAARLPSILPDMSPMEALELSMIHSIAGSLANGNIIRQRPFRDPHHSASQAALIGGGHKARPGEISLAHHGVLFLDELPEFPRATLESLRQPLETGQAVIARANHHVTYPARFQFIAAMNPCRCGHVGDAAQACSRAPKCAADYQAKLSGPLLDRFDLFVDVPAVSIDDLQNLPNGESSADIRARVIAARQTQMTRHKNNFDTEIINAHLQGEALEQVTALNDKAKALMRQASTAMNLSARGYTRVLRVARSIADLDHSDTIQTPHLAEALSFRNRGMIV